MGFIEGSKWQERMQDEVKAKSKNESKETKKSVKLLMPKEQVENALLEAGKIMAVCYELTGANGKSALVISSSGKNYKITFESL